LNADDKTMNLIPPVGQYTWKQRVHSSEVSIVMINTSISSEFPLPSRDITVTLGSETQFQRIYVPTESIQFEFTELNSNRKEYPLKINFTLTGATYGNLPSVTNIFYDTITFNIANKQSFSYCLLILFFVNKIKSID